MAEFFLELFSEEVPAELQKNLRNKLLEKFQSFFLEKSIKSKKSFSLSTSNRLVIVFEGLSKEIKIPSTKIKGPKITRCSFILRNQSTMKINSILWQKR